MKNIFLIMVMFGLITIKLTAQKTIKTENEYSRNSFRIVLLQNQVDSLNRILDKKSDLISSEKNRSNKNENYLNQLYAQSSEIAGEIKIKQNELSRLESHNNKVRQQIYNHYSSQMDSLQSLNSKSDLTEKQIFNLSEKLVLYSPRLYPLKYEPAKLIEMKKQASEKTSGFLADYINQAKNEVNEQLQKIDLLITEVVQVDKLRKKTEEFSQEFDMGRDIVVKSNLNYKTTETDFRGESTEKGQNSLTSNVISINIILNQIIAAGITDGRNIKNLNEKNISLDSYKNYLLEVKKYLNSYKKILQQKSN